MNGFPSVASRLGSIGDDLRDIAKRLDALCAHNHFLAESINAIPGQEFISDMARDFDTLARAAEREEDGIVRYMAGVTG